MAGERCLADLAGAVRLRQQWPRSGPTANHCSVWSRTPNGHVKKAMAAMPLDLVYDAFQERR